MFEERFGALRRADWLAAKDVPDLADAKQARFVDREERVLDSHRAPGCGWTALLVVQGHLTGSRSAGSSRHCMGFSRCMTPPHSLETIAETGACVGQ